MTLWAIIWDFVRGLFSFDQAHPLLFTRFYFWAFFALVFAFFSLFGNRVLQRNAYLFACSLFFYYKTSGAYLLLLVFVIVFNYFAARWIRRARRPGVGKALMVAGIVADLSLLAYFKYAYFLTDLVNGLAGTHLTIVDRIILPVGISFFIFQAVSYIVDVRRGRVEPVRNFLDFGFYLSFFPQLVAGPIVRASEFIPQIHRPYTLSRRWFGIAVFWIVNGLVKKLVLSDYIAVNFCDRVFGDPLLYTGFENLTALFGYSLQVYADFSGYTDIATGVALLMGFYLPRNFNSPYKARDAGEFWKRWHISLSNWLKDYLYIPLGGNRNATPGTFLCIGTIALIGVFLSGSPGVAAVVAGIAVTTGLVALVRPGRRRAIVTQINSLDTMLLGGLWHGASWNFMMWGGLNGIGIIVCKVWKGLDVYVRVLVITGVCILLGLLRLLDPRPVWNMLLVWGLFTWLGALVQMLRTLFGRRGCPWLRTAWAVCQTFVFITFTRLFFRSGSNLDPAVANETAWRMARDMVSRIGGAWDFSLIPAMVRGHRTVFLLILAGLLIHWLPERWKRRYRLAFARLPLGVMLLVVCLILLVAYQFVTADLQAFIYFQF